MTKFKTFEITEAEPYGKYLRFHLDGDSNDINEFHYLPKELFPDILLKNNDVSTQLTIISDDDLCVWSNPFGQEAEELRKEFEKLHEDIGYSISDSEDDIDIFKDELERVSKKIREILDNVDARDSLFYLENGGNGTK